MELCLYNSVLTGMSNDGKAFIYDNPLATCDVNISERLEWFEIACCPPNMTRTLEFLDGYVWSSQANAESREATVNVYLYTAASLKLEVGGSIIRIQQSTDWPWDGAVEFNMTTDGPAVDLDLRLTIPGWSSNHEV
jgi:DUF1680 family protein